MSEPETPSDPVSEDEPATSSPPPVPVVESGPPAAPIQGGRLWLVVLAAALLGVGLAWLGGEAVFGLYVLPAELDQRAASVNATQNDMDEAAWFRFRNETRNGALALGLLGSALGVTMGLAGGIVGRRLNRAPGASMLGLILGGALGVGAVLAIYPRLKTPASANSDDLVSVLLLHGVLAAAVGASAGLAFGLGLGERGWTARALLGGLVGAVLAVLLFQMAAGAAFPIGRPDYLVPSASSTRLAAKLAIGLGAALGVCLSRPAAPKTTVKVQPPAAATS